MIKDALIKQLGKRGYSKTRPYDNKHSVLDSNEFVLDEKTDIEKVLSLIQKLYPYQVEKDLIRLGPDGDGGYLVPDDLDGIEACFSPGVSSVSGFEQDCFNRGMKLFLADKSVEKPMLAHKEYNFIKKFIGCSSNEDFITIDDWVKSSNIDDKSDLILQMDIEGFEYVTLINMSNELLKRFRIIVVEFHTLHKLWHEGFFHFASNALLKILESHTCVHIHPNNYSGIDEKNGISIPRMAEFTFFRNDRFTNKKSNTEFPHRLDFDNTIHPHVALPEIWFRTPE